MEFDALMTESRYYDLTIMPSKKGKFVSDIEFYFNHPVNFKVIIKDVSPEDIFNILIKYEYSPHFTF